MTIDDYMKKINGKNSKEHSYSYKRSIIKRTLFTVTMVLIVLIISNIHKPTRDLLYKYIFETNYNFSTINKIYKKYFLDLPKKTLNSDKLVSTNKTLEYTDYEEYLDGVSLNVGENYNVKLIESGLVVFIGEKDEYGSTIIVQQSNGIDVTYGNVKVTDIKVYDYIEKGTIIGIADNTLYLNFTKDGEKLDYKTYIK